MQRGSSRRGEKIRFWLGENIHRTDSTPLRPTFARRGRTLSYTHRGRNKCLARFSCLLVWPLGHVMVVDPCYLVHRNNMFHPSPLVSFSLLFLLGLYLAIWALCPRFGIYSWVCAPLAGQRSLILLFLSDIHLTAFPLLVPRRIQQTHTHPFLHIRFNLANWRNAPSWTYHTRTITMIKISHWCHGQSTRDTSNC